MNKPKTKNKSKQKMGNTERKKTVLLCAFAVVLVAAAVTAIALIIHNKSKKNETETPQGGELASLEFSDEALYDGYFEEDVVDVVITCLSGTPDCYTMSGNTVTFENIAADSVYAISGKLKGNIVINVSQEYKLDLELHGFSLVSDATNPITVQNGREISIKAKKDYKNYIYDMRTAIDESDETLLSGAIYAAVDLEIAGKGELTVLSEHNNGIHTKDDLQVKNLTLTVMCVDNALKGNDSVTVEGGNTTLIARQGDGIKTTNSNISEKGNQRGTVTVMGGTHTIGAACDGIDAAYNVVIDDDTTTLNIYTDKYCSSSEEVTATAEDTYYLRTTLKGYKYAVKYYNSEEDVLWVVVEDDYETVTSQKRPGSSGTTYYYYQFAKKSSYQKLAVYMYSSSGTSGQDSDYYACSSYKALNDSYDTVIATYDGNNTLSVGWTNYSTTTSGMGGGMGGMNEGNSDKGEYSTKGIKAANEILIKAGAVNVKSYDDAIHANNDTTLENGATPLGNVTVSGGTVTVYSNDDGLHADGALSVAGGTVSVLNSYEGAEGNTVTVSGGALSIISSDDGINGTATAGTAITVSGGEVYIYCSGDGIDSNSRTSYAGVVFCGGQTVVISNSSGNSAIDTESGYAYTGGTVVSIMPSRGMTSEATHCSNFSSVATAKTLNLNEGEYLCATVKGAALTLKMPCSISAYVIALGDSAASLSAKGSADVTLNASGVCWE